MRDVGDAVPYRASPGQMCALRRDTWVPPYGVRRGAGGQSRPPLRTLSLRASAHTGAAIRPQRGAAALTGRRTPRAFVPLRSTAGRRPLRAVRRTCPAGRLALRPPFIPAGVSSRAAEQSIPPVMQQCAHLTFRRQQASSHPLTCHGMVPQASRTHFSGITKPRDFRRGVSLSKKPVIASQSADWRGNPFPNRIIPALFRRFPAKRLRIPTPVTSVTGSE